MSVREMDAEAWCAVVQEDYATIILKKKRQQYQFSVAETHLFHSLLGTENPLSLLCCQVPLTSIKVSRKIIIAQ